MIQTSLGAGGVWAAAGRSVLDEPGRRRRERLDGWPERPEPDQNEPQPEREDRCRNGDVLRCTREELLAEGAAVLDAAEAIRELGPVLQSPELAFRIRVVVGNVGAAVGLGDAEVGHQKGDGFGGHGRAAVGMNVELAGLDFLFLQVSAMSCLASSGLSRVGHHPADDVAAEDVEDDVEIEVGPLGRTAAVW